MNRTWKALLVALIALGGLVEAQQSVMLTAVAPQGPQNVRASVVGTPGNATYCYWVAANYVGGTVLSANPACVQNGPNTLSSPNNVSVSWASITVDPPGTVGYSIVRTTSAAIRPAPGATILVRTLGATQWNDTGAALSVWSPAGFPFQTASEVIRLNNRDFVSPMVQFFTWPLALGPPNSQVAFSTNLTLAQVNAGTVIVPAVSNRTLRVDHFILQALGGATAGCTDVRISDTSVGPVDVVTALAAALTQNTVVTEATASNVTLGAFATQQLTAGTGLQVRSTGSACTTATSYNVTVFYQINF